MLIFFFIFYVSEIKDSNFNLLMIDKKNIFLLAFPLASVTIKSD